MEAEGRVQSEDSLILADSSWPEDRNLNPKPLSSRFFPPKRGSSPTKRGSSPTKRGSSPTKGRIETNNNNAVDNPKDRFKGAKQLFLSLERKKEKRSPVRRDSPPGKEAVRKGRDVSEVRSSSNLEVKQLEGQARWSRYEKEAGSGQDSRWPKSDRDTGYVSRYSRDKSRSRDFDDSPPATTKQTIFTKSGKKSSLETKDKYTNNRRLSRFLSRETLESDGYDKIDEFDEPDPQRNKVKRNHSRTSLKLDMRKEEVGPEVPPGPRRGMLRREVTELDFKGYRQANNQDGFSRKYIPRQGPVWPGPKERAMSPVRALSPVRGSRFVEEGERFHHPATKVIPAEYRRDGAHNHHHDHHQRYPSLDFRNDKRKTVFESDLRKLHYEPGQDYRRRSYHELSGDIDKLDARNFQHSGRKVAGEPLGLPIINPRSYKPLPETPRAYKPLPEPPRNYKPLPEHQRYPGLERENSRLNLGPAPYKSAGYPARNGPLPFDHPGNRPAMYRHSYAETSTPSSFARVSPSPLGGRFGLASLKPY